MVAGWGKSNADTNHENEPKRIDVPIHANEHCFFDHPDLLRIASPRTFCAGNGDGTGVCNGDSGGGLLVLHQDQYYLKGIVSASVVNTHRMCDVTKYAIFTNVFKYTKWMDSFISSDPYTEYSALFKTYEDLQEINSELAESKIILK